MCCCLCIILPLLVLCTLWPVYMLSAFRYLVKRAQALLQVMACSVKRLVPTASGLVMKWVIGWPASA